VTPLKNASLYPFQKSVSHSGSKSKKKPLVRSFVRSAPSLAPLPRSLRSLAPLTRSRGKLATYEQYQGCLEHIEPIKKLRFTTNLKHCVSFTVKKTRRGVSLLWLSSLFRASFFMLQFVIRPLCLIGYR